jgi:hypothetical protein
MKIDLRTYTHSNRTQATNTLNNLLSFDQSPDAHESMHAMLSLLVITIVRADTCHTFDGVCNELSVLCGRGISSSAKHDFLCKRYMRMLL